MLIGVVIVSIIITTEWIDENVNKGLIAIIDRQLIDQFGFGNFGDLDEFVTALEDVTTVGCGTGLASGAAKGRAGGAAAGSSTSSASAWIVRSSGTSR
mmetsp:Transcript_61009/g.92217  ORF Transcript_61009/g.92217 Transcript_61009/m.92217 type:complete len:98 (-) Transcript_61009:77-370(-)